MGHVFFNGLIDENAACHLAFGTSFPSNIKDGSSMSKEELLSLLESLELPKTEYYILGGGS